MRLALARALMAPSELLLLDEPTNHLDLDAMLWLERWLAAYQGTVLLISHDTEFLDSVAQTILHFDQGKLVRYRGGYQDFVVARAERLRQSNIAWERQTRESARLQSFIDRFKAKASKAKQAQSRVKALARMELLAPIHVESGIDIRIPSPDNMPDPLLVLEDMQAGYLNDHGDAVPILRNINLMVRGGDRIGILGVNGAGKSTLSKRWRVNCQRSAANAVHRAGSKLATSRSTSSTCWTLMQRRYNILPALRRTPVNRSCAIILVALGSGVSASPTSSHPCPGAKKRDSRLPSSSGRNPTCCCLMSPVITWTSRHARP